MRHICTGICSFGLMPARTPFTHKKRAPTTAPSAEVLERFKGIEMESFLEEVVVLKPSDQVFDMDLQSDRERLAQMVWRQDVRISGDGCLAASNPAIAQLLGTLTRNSYRRRGDTEHANAAAELQIEAILSCLARTQSQKKITLLCARLSLAMYQAQLPRDTWQMFHALAPGLLASYNWTEDFQQFAMDFRPNANDDTLPGVGACMFDNYTRRVNYKSKATTESSGYRLDMTNSCSMAVPRHCANAQFDAMAVGKCLLPCPTPVLHACIPLAFPERIFIVNCAADNPLVPRISMAGFISLFLRNNQRIIANQNARFARYLRNAQDMHNRPTTRPTWKAHMTYHPPMFGLLQCKYDHVEEELQRMRNFHKRDQIVFIGGDGLSIMRLNALISQDPVKYLESKPVVVPVQGESPHGIFHILHSGWRLYVRFIRQCALHLNKYNSAIHKWVKDEPTVSDFNNSLHFLCRIARAATEYLVHLSQTPGAPALGDVQHWRNAAHKNIDFAWIFHFLYDFAFLLLDFKYAVRANNSDAIDLMWREFIQLGRPRTGNKTQYCPMAVMRVFWSEAMHPHLKELYTNLRTIPMTQNEGSRVGWDMPCEWLNLAITQGVRYQVSEERIAKFVKGFSLTSANNDLLRAQFLCQRQHRQYKMKCINEDSIRLKTFFMQKVGDTWANATNRNVNSRLGITRGLAPWIEMERMAIAGGKDSLPHYISETVRRYTRSFYTFNP